MHLTDDTEREMRAGHEAVDALIKAESMICDLRDENARLREQLHELRKDRDDMKDILLGIAKDLCDPESHD